MTFEFAENDERVVVGLDDVVGLPEPDSNVLVRCSSALAVVDGDRGVLGGPLEVLVRLALVHVLLDVEHDDVVEHLHLERDPARVRRPRSTEDELDLDVLPRSTGDRVDGLRVPRVGRPDHVASLVRRVDGEDADKDVDGGERVGEGVGEGALDLAVGAPGEGDLVVREDVDEERGEGCGKAGEEEEGEEDGEGLRRDPGLAKEGGGEGREAGSVAGGLRGRGEGVGPAT